jgi:hypothetical protein
MFKTEASTAPTPALHQPPRPTPTRSSGRWLAVYISLTKLPILTCIHLTDGSFWVLNDCTQRSGRFHGFVLLGYIMVENEEIEDVQNRSIQLLLLS